MKILFSLLFGISSTSLWAIDYDPAFHLRHRFNATKNSLKDKHVSNQVYRFQDPRVGLKGQPVPKYYKVDKE